MSFVQGYSNALMVGREQQAQQDHRNALLEMQRQNQAFNQGIASRRLAISEEQLQMSRDAVQRGLDDIARTRGLEDAQREAEQDLRLGALFRQAYDAGDMQAMQGVWSEMTAGEQGPQMPLTAENVDQVAGLVRAGTDAYQGWLAAAPQAPKAADTYQRYVQEEQAAGRQPLSRIEFARAQKTTQEISVGPDGTVRISEGFGGEGGGEGLNPSSPDAMIASIDGILNDPALDLSTGMLAWTQALPGTPMRRVGARINQLNGQAFLQAFESLKGAGQITEIEGKKATDAIGRLDSAQRTEDYVGALQEVRGILATAAQRPKGWVEQQARAGLEAFPAADIQAMSPEQITALGPDALVRIPVTELQGLSDAQWEALEGLTR